MIDSTVVFVGFMSLFLDYLWIWIVLTFVVGIGGYSLYLNDQKGHNFMIAVLAPLLTLALGLTLYYGVDTDRKSICRMLDALIAAIEKDDVVAVHNFISEKAINVRLRAEAGMRMARISRAKYHNLEIEVNDAASPPIANVRFNAIFYWKSKQLIEGIFVEQPVPQRVQFEIELVKTKGQSWMLTGKYRDDLRFEPNR